MHSGSEPHPLYFDPEDTRDPSAVARLDGPIGSVDGKDVKGEGKSFALAPGCHVVMLAQKTGQINNGGVGGFVASLPQHMVWAFRMRAQHAYQIEVELDRSSGPTGSLAIHAWDRDQQGGATEVAPIRNTLEVDDCRKWRP
ncbi:MAG TPA: hypothetical protein VN903_00610 [Polyangia bacterium]|nr:hypothetical protein [Polyangia bacterium]